MILNINNCNFKGNNSGMFENVVVVQGHNVMIVNGRILNAGELGENREIDERKIEDAKNIEKISISSEVFDINILTSFDSSKIEAHCYGEAKIDGEVKLTSCVVNRELRIGLKFDGSCYRGRIRFEVTVPHKTFKEIFAKSVSANIIVDENVLVENFRAETTSGNVRTNATFANAFIKTTSGNVELQVDATSNITTKVSSTSGNVSAEFNNIRRIDLSAHSCSGDIRNRHKEKTGYDAKVNVSTTSGDIRIK